MARRRLSWKKTGLREFHDVGLKRHLTIYEVDYQAITTVYQYSGQKNTLKDIDSRCDSFLARILPDCVTVHYC